MTRSPTPRSVAPYPGTTVRSSGVRMVRAFTQFWGHPPFCSLRRNSHSGNHLPPSLTPGQVGGNGSLEGCREKHHPVDGEKSTLFLKKDPHRQTTHGVGHDVHLTSTGFHKDGLKNLTELGRMIHAAPYRIDRTPRGKTYLFLPTVTNEPLLHRRHVQGPAQPPGYKKDGATLWGHIPFLKPQRFLSEPEDTPEKESGGQPRTVLQRLCLQWPLPYLLLSATPDAGGRPLFSFIRSRSGCRKTLERVVGP